MEHEHEHEHEDEDGDHAGHTHASVHALHIVPLHMFPHFFRSLRSTRACNHMHMHACES